MIDEVKEEAIDEVKAEAAAETVDEAKEEAADETIDEVKAEDTAETIDEEKEVSEEPAEDKVAEESDEDEEPVFDVSDFLTIIKQDQAKKTWTLCYMILDIGELPQQNLQNCAEVHIS
mgnify:CR=1 FL=1